MLFRRSCAFVICAIIVFTITADRNAPTIHEKGGPSKATRWRLSAMRDEHGRIATDGRIKALEQLQQNLDHWQRQGVRATIAGNWTPRGPFDRSGRIRALVIHPKDSNVLWAAAGSGGVWKSEDRGATWRPLTDKLGLPAGSLVMDPKNPEVLYFGTGERFHSGGPGAGIYITRNGGETWKRLPGTRKWRYIPAIAISPKDSNLILAAVADPEFPERAGIYRSTNGGRRWSRVLRGDFFTPSALAFQPQSGSRILASIRDGLFPRGDAQIKISDDAGVNWRRSSGIGTTQFTRYEIAYSTSHPNIAYALSNEGVYKSTDGGESFARTSPRLEVGIVSWAAMLWVSPTDPNLLLAGGVSLARSRDGGVNWKRVEYYEIQNRDAGHLDHHAVVADAGFGKDGNRAVYIVNDGGVDRFKDVTAPKLGPGQTIGLDNGLQTTEYYAVAGRGSDGMLLGGAQDRGILRGRLALQKTEWAMGGDGVCAILDPKDQRYQYGCGQLLWIVRLEPNGLIGLSNDLIDAVPPNDEVRANFKAPAMLDPNNPKRMFAGGASLWRSENVRKATHEAGNRAIWKEVKPPLPRISRYDERGLISAFAVADGDSNLIWVAHNDGRIYRTRNALASPALWEAMDDNAQQNPLPNRFPARILIDRTKSARVFVAFGGFTPDNLWVTEDSGRSWRSASGRANASLPSAPIWSLAQHPKNADTLMAGTEVGVYISRDRGHHWAAIRAPFTAAAQDIAFLQGTTTLLVGTFGRGWWTIEVES